MSLGKHRFIRLLALIAFVLFWARAETALAHAVLVTADPAPNAILATAPTQVRILFSEPVVPAFSQIMVIAQSGQQVEVGELRPANDDHTALVVSVPPLAQGTYLVSWRALSAVDGHTTSGSFPFGVGVEELAATTSANASTAQQPTVFSAGARWLNLTGLALLVGLFAFRLFVWNPVFRETELDEAEKRLDLDFGRAGLNVGRVGLALLGLGLVFTLIGQSMSSNQPNLLNIDNLRVWLGTRFGSMWLLRADLVGVAWLLLAFVAGGMRRGREGLRGWPWWTGLALVLGLILTTSAVSHSAALTVDATQALAVDFLHVLAAGVWIGGLLQLGLALLRSRPLGAESRAWLSLSLILNFSTMAAAAVGVLLLSGGYLASKHVGGWRELFGTAYGLALLAKLALAAPALGIAAYNLLVIKPRLDAAFDLPEAEASQQAQRRFSRWVRAEAVFGLLVLTATGLLTDLQRGQDAPLLSEQAGRVALIQKAGGMDVALTLEPGRLGQNLFDVYLTNGGQPVTNAREVSLRFTFLGHAMGASNAQATPSGDGHYRVEGGYLGIEGPWQIEVAIRRPDAFDAFAPFRVEVQASRGIQPIGGQADFAERLAEFLTQSGGGLTGIFLALFAIAWAFLATRAAKWRWQVVPLLIPAIIVSWIAGIQLTTFFQEYTPAKFTTNPILPDEASIARGQALYRTHCMACHGPEGRGNGPAAAGLSPPPADFTAGHTESHPDGDLYYWIKEGFPGSAMPAFGAQLKDEDVWHLVNYVRRLSAQGAPMQMESGMPMPSGAPMPP